MLSLRSNSDLSSFPQRSFKHAKFKAILNPCRTTFARVFPVWDSSSTKLPFVVGDPRVHGDERKNRQSMTMLLRTNGLPDQRVTKTPSPANQRCHEFFQHEDESKLSESKP